MTNNTNTKGFTIIEVVLVLAIAGLIFLVVFLALPALQRSQRDTQRKSDLGKFMSQVTTYQSNNQGALPATANGSQATWNTFISNYLTNGGQSFSDPQSGSTYDVSTVTNTPGTVPTLAAGELRVYIGAKCGSGGTVANTGTRNFAAVVFQEQGNFACQNN